MLFEEIVNPRQRAFLAAYAESGIIKLAARMADVDRTCHYKWSAQDAAYAQAFQLARQLAADALEDEARERAVAGKSDRLLMFLLRGLKPELYGTRRREIEAEPKIEHAPDLSMLSDEELHTLERLAQKAQGVPTEPKFLLPAESSFR